MQLSLVERWMLSNQYRILEGLYPKEAKTFQKAREVVEGGYESEYDFLIEDIDPDVVTEKEGEFVRDVLDMYLNLQDSYVALGDNVTLDHVYVVFSGFAGNSETKFVSYVNYLVKNNLGLKRLKTRDGMNSHTPRLHIYQDMLERWKESPNPYSLSEEDIARIVGR